MLYPLLDGKIQPKVAVVALIISISEQAKILSGRDIGPQSWGYHPGRVFVRVVSLNDTTRSAFCDLMKCSIVL